MTGIVAETTFGGEHAGVIGQRRNPAVLAASVESVRLKVDRIDERTTAIESRVSAIESRMATKDDITTVRGDIERLDLRLDGIDRSLTILGHS